MRRKFSFEIFRNLKYEESINNILQNDLIRLFSNDLFLFKIYGKKL